MLYESQGRSLNEGGYSIELPVQRKDLAALLGATPESISRLINRLAREGFVHFTARHVLVSDWDRLAAEIQSFN
jgi:CRP-like cAMP-binding protein